MMPFCRDDDRLIRMSSPPGDTLKPGTLSLSVAGDRIGEALVADARRVALALKVTADCIEEDPGTCAPGICR